LRATFPPRRGLQVSLALLGFFFVSTVVFMLGPRVDLLTRRSSRCQHCAVGIDDERIGAVADRRLHRNDTHGHDVGDEVLRVVAARAQHEVRPADVLARWGARNS